MRVISICAAKGGSSKSTLTAAVAVRLSEKTKGSRVAMLDLNSDQASLTKWWQLRGSPDQPFLHEDIADLELDLQALKRTGFTHCVVDSPPYDMELIETTIMLSDVILIPVRPSLFDENAIRVVVGMCLKRRKPFGFVLTDVDNRPQFKSHTEKIAGRLRELGPVCETRFPHSAHYLTSLETGKTGHEVEKGSDLKNTMDALCAEIDSLAATRPAYVARSRVNV